MELTFTNMFQIGQYNQMNMMRQNKTPRKWKMLKKKSLAQPTRMTLTYLKDFHRHLGGRGEEWWKHARLWLESDSQALSVA